MRGLAQHLSLPVPRRVIEPEARPGGGGRAKPHGLI